MKLGSRRVEEPDINLTSLIDVVFLLLIFFMVSTTFERESELAIELPQASGEAAEQEDAVLELAIDGQGRFFVNGQQVVNTQVETLKRVMRKALTGTQERRLVISADRRTPHQSVITAMDAARQLGLTRLTFATRQADDDQPRP